MLIDLHGYFSLELLAYLAAGAPELVVTEMLPGPDELWLTGDVANHPLQVENRDRRSFADADPDQAAATRRDVFGRAEHERSLIAPAHFPDPFGTIVGGSWEPIDAGDRRSGT